MAKRKPISSPAEQLDVLRFAVGPTALGTILVAVGRRGVAAIVLAADPRRAVATLHNWFPKSELIPGSRDDEALVSQVAAHVDDPTQPLRFKLDLRGTPFQNRVWNAVRKIPAGTTLTYADVASRIRAPRAMRAVGSSCAKCRHWFAVPCHRVIASGSPGSSKQSAARPGSDRRAQLLKREIALLKRL
jgi:AraC family transcriptional regulator of adaptative response/methylated-DNA-[protein]-cysteine methyltransferase